ncbi:hypothetical protein ACOSZF_24450, partial [Cytobacillus firmus]|uniref:hypothetical protein n=1 Tax=Cytobacillus firmus TaxID=1399 RepID=UPI003BA242EF
ASMVGFTARSMPGTGEVNQSYQHPHLIKRWGLFYAYGENLSRVRQALAPLALDRTSPEKEK